MGSILGCKHNKVKVDFYKITKGTPAPGNFGPNIVAQWAVDYIGCCVTCEKCKKELGKFYREYDRLPEET